MKIALLDDNQEQLERNQRFLKNLAVEVVTASLSAKTFLQEVKLSKPEILVLDLNLGDSYMTGMEVAFELKLPVLFASSNTPEYVKEMERLKRDEVLCVDHITKPFTELEFQKTLTRFLQEVKFFGNQHHVTLDLGKQKRTKIALESIVYLVADKASGSESNNKEIYFNNRNKELLIDFSFTRMEEKGLTKSQFITIHKSYRVNVNHIIHYCKKSENVGVEVFTSSGKLETKHLPVSENYQSVLKPFKK